MSQASGWCECDGRAVGEGDYWAGVGRCKGESWATQQQRSGGLCFAVAASGKVACLSRLPVGARPRALGASLC